MSNLLRFLGSFVAFGFLLCLALLAFGWLFRFYPVPTVLFLVLGVTHLAAWGLGLRSGSREWFTLCQHVATGHANRLSYDQVCQLWRFLHEYQRQFPDPHATPAPTAPPDPVGHSLFTLSERLTRRD